MLRPSGARGARLAPHNNMFLCGRGPRPGLLLEGHKAEAARPVGPPLHYHDLRGDGPSQHCQRTRLLLPGVGWRRLLARVTPAGTPGAGNGGAAVRQGVRTASSTSPYSPKCSRRISFVAGHGRPPRNRRRPLLSPLGAALPDGKRSRPLPHERPWLGVAVSRRTFLRSPPLLPPARPRVDPPSGVDGARFPANVLYRPNVRLRLP